ncbi:MAG: trypsin-like peptidase domain-containing protein [Planctomycetota bacterium]
MHRIVLACAVVACLLTVALPNRSEDELAARLASVERSVGDVRDRAVGEAEVAALEARLGELQEALADRPDALDGTRRLAAVQGALEKAHTVVADQAARIEELERLAREVGRIEELGTGAQGRVEGLVRALEATTSIALETRDELGRVRSRIGADNEALWDAMVGPTVQLAGETTVGSGVLLPSRPVDDGARFETVLLTAWHVVRDIRADALDADAPIPVFVRDEHGTKQEFGARLVDHDAPLDAALLVIETDEPFAVGALLPTRERLAAARVFDPIVAVGCPLGNDPIPTVGQLTDLHHLVGGAEFWMISAPTYIGNSGGGLFAKDSHELVGVFTKIYTHGAIRPTVIPHMGLATPLEAFYDWIDAGEAARVVEAHGSAAVVLR